MKKAIIEALRLQSIGGYRPDGVDAATVTGIFWDKEHRRIALSLLYDNGETDWIPASEVTLLDSVSSIVERAYKVVNK